MHALGIHLDQTADAHFMRGRGCPRCLGSGFKGRIGIFEIFLVDSEIEQMIYENATVVDLRDKARELGMRTLREDGIRKVLAGMTTISEVLRSTVVNH